MTVKMHHEQSAQPWHAVYNLDFSTLSRSAECRQSQRNSVKLHHSPGHPCAAHPRISPPGCLPLEPLSRWPCPCGTGSGPARLPWARATARAAGARQLLPAPALRLRRQQRPAVALQPALRMPGGWVGPSVLHLSAPLAGQTARDPHVGSSSPSSYVAASARSK